MGNNHQRNRLIRRFDIQNRIQAIGDSIGTITLEGFRWASLFC